MMQADLTGRKSISDIAGALQIPVWRLNRLFNRYLHAAPKTYFAGLRLAKARDMLRNTTLTVGEIANECGYDNADAFSRAYRTQFGIAPSFDRTL